MFLKLHYLRVGCLEAPCKFSNAVFLSTTKGMGYQKRRFFFLELQRTPKVKSHPTLLAGEEHSTCGSNCVVPAPGTSPSQPHRESGSGVSVGKLLAWFPLVCY